MFEGEESSAFIREFAARRERMLEFLDAVEGSALQLDRMHRGARISSIASSSVGATGGVLAIAGLVLGPVTAGASLALTVAGLGMGVTSGVNTIVTTATEAGVNRTQTNKANRALGSFMSDVEAIHDALEGVAMKNIAQEQLSAAMCRVVARLGGLARALDGLVDAVSAFRAGELLDDAARVGEPAARGARVAQELPDVGQAAARGPLALSRAARTGFILANALFVGLDVFFIIKDGMSLAKGSQSEAVKFLRARAALWRSQVKTWEKMCNSQQAGEEKVEKNRAVLQEPFYPRNPEEEGEEEQQRSW